MDLSEDMPLEQVIDVDEPIAEIDLIAELVESIVSYHDLITFPQPGLKCESEPIFHQSSHNLDNYDLRVHVKEIGDQLEWELDLPDDLIETSTLSSGKRSCPRLLKYKIRHEFVSEGISGDGTDIPLNSVFERMGDGYDSLTPDIIIFSNNGMVHIIEIGTTRAIWRNLCTRVMNEKLFKYFDAAEIRARDKVVTLTAIIVTPDSVLSNVKLSQRVVNDLSDRMAIALLLEDNAESMGIKMQQEHSETMKEIYASEIREEIKKVENKNQLKGNTKLSIDDNFINQAIAPPDVEEVKKCYINARKKAIKSMDNAKSSDHYIAKYRDKYNKNKSYRKDQKPISIFPLVCPSTTSDSQLPRRFVLTGSGKHEELIKLWNEALSRINNKAEFREEDKSLLLKEATAEKPTEILRLEKKRKEGRRKYHRVDLKRILTNKVKKFIARDGVLAKSLKNSPEQIVRKAQQKSQFAWDTRIDDISSCMVDSKLLEKSTKGLDPSNDNILDLLKTAQSMSKNDGVNLGVIDSWMNTKLYQALDLISNISFELAISAKQNTSSSEFILKKLRYHACYILIKPTNSKSHIHFSLFFPELSENDILNQSPFRPLHKVYKGYLTDFCSVRLDKIENQASINVTLLCLVAFWSDFHQMDGCLPADFKTNISAFSMLMFSLLVKLEDKSETEETITLTRYMYMEVFKSNLTMRPPEPFKVLTKFCTNPRSRLNLWVIRKVIQGFLMMEENVPRKVKPLNDMPLEEGEDSLPGDEWIGLINVFNYSNITTSSAAVNLMYIGYLKNKNEVSQGNTDWTLLNKVLEEEFAVVMDKDSVRKMTGGLKHDDKVDKKNFSIDCISYGVSLLEGRLEKKKGKNWKTILGNEICNKLAEQLTHEISTLKASSTYESRDTEKLVRKDDKDFIQRIKVIEAIAAKLKKFNLNPFLNLNEFISSISNTSEGVTADLFKKNQHGGLREIYVLNIESRIIQLFIETISRTICSHFDEETLTHPQNKLTLIDAHKTRSHKQSMRDSTFYADLCSSSDKTRWNQNFQIRALSVPLFRLTPEEFHPAIKRCMNFWCNKKIKIPPAVCKLLVNNIPLNNDTYTELKKKFLGHKLGNKNNLGLAKPSSTFATVSTGMMQGILHYTSSLLHLSFLSAGKNLTLTFLHYVSPTVKHSMTQVCSSDDSATVLSLHSEVDAITMKPVDLNSFYEAEVALHTLTFLCNYFCMLESVKSTIGVPDCVEFNSEFLFKNTIAVPTIKYIAACTNLTESESLMDRFYTFYNLISDLFATGFPADKTSLCQLAQGVLHYKTMGSYTNGLFQNYVELLMKVPSPIYGFFLMDTELFPGVIGFQFSRWMSLESSDNLKNSIKTINYGELESNSDGSVHESLIIKHGDNRRYKQLLHTIQSTDIKKDYNKIYKIQDDKMKAKLEKEHVERIKLIEENYMLMYRHPNSLQELKLKLMMKASMPGISKSLSKGVPFIQSLQMSMYAINTHSFTTTRFKIEEDKKTEQGHFIREKETSKLSLILALQKKLKELSLVTQDDESYEKNLRLMFPMMDRYNEARSVLESYTNKLEIKTHRMRFRKNTVFIHPKTMSIPLTLLQTMCAHWFDFTVKVSNNVLKRCIEHYKFNYPWLKDCIQDTLKESPFSTMIELYAFLSAAREKIRKFVRNGPSVQSNRFVGQLHQLVRKSYKRNTITLSTDKRVEQFQRKDLFQNKLSLSLTIPLSSVRNTKAREVLHELSLEPHLLENLPYMNRRNKVISMISLFKEGKIGIDTLTDHIRLLNTGFIMSYTNPQKLVLEGNVKKWKGYGECIFESDGVFFKFYLQDEFVTRIMTNNWSRLRANYGLVKDAMNKTHSYYNIEKVEFINCVARFDGSRFQSPSGRGIPVYEDPDYESVKFDLVDCKVKIEYGKVSLLTSVRGDPISVLEFSTNLRDFTFYKREKTEERFIWDFWINQSSMDIQTAVQEIDSIERYVSSFRNSEADRKNLTNWIKSTLSHRVKYLGAGHTINTTMFESIGHSVQQEEWDDDEFASWYDEIGGCSDDHDLLEMIHHKEKELATDFAKTKKNLEPHEELELDEVALRELLEEMYKPDELDSPLALLYSNWTESTKIGDVTTMNKDTMSYLYIHPLWDEFIQEIQSMDSTFFTKVLQGVVAVVDQGLSKKLMKIMDIQEKKVELNITQRFAGSSRPEEGEWW